VIVSQFFFGSGDRDMICLLLPECHCSEINFDRSRKFEESKTERVDGWFGSNILQFIPVENGPWKEWLQRLCPSPAYKMHNDYLEAPRF